MKHETSSSGEQSGQASLVLPFQSFVVSAIGSIGPALVGIGGTLILGSSGSTTLMRQVLLLWTVVGFLTLTDLGLTRTGSKLVAEGGDPRSVVRGLWRYGSVPAVLLLLVLLLMAFAMGARDDAKFPIWLLIAAVLPLVTISQFPVYGALEGLGRWHHLAWARVSSSLITYLLPAAMVHRDEAMSLIAGVLVSGRVAILVLLVLVALPPANPRSDDVISPRSNLGILTWVGLSSLIGPAMLYADRLALSFATSNEHVWTSYVLASEMLLKTYIIPSALVAVLFPMFVSAVRRFELPVSWIARRVPAITAVIGLTAGALASVVVVLGDIAARLGLPASLGSLAAVVAGLLVAGTIVNWVSQGYIALLHALNLQRLVVAAQLWYVPLYAAALAIGALTESVLMVATVWTVRVVATNLTLVVVSTKEVQDRAAAQRRG